MLKKKKVVMLPTNEKALIYKFKETNTLILSHHPNQKDEAVPQHLYIISDEEIKESDWKLCEDGGGFYIHQHKLGGLIKDYQKKIIATTDNSLSFRSYPTDDWSVDYPAKVEAYYSHRILPQLSEAFIEVFIREYNKGNIITNVMVEYEQNNPSIQNILADDGKYKPKVSPKDNTITIKRVKDSWNREEMEEKARLAFKAGMERESLLRRGFTKEAISEDKWIEENI